MEREAELACKQAYLLWPRSPEAVWHYTTFLIGAHRAEEAQKFVAAARNLNPDDKNLKSLERYVGQMVEWERSNK